MPSNREPPVCGLAVLKQQARTQDTLTPVSQLWLHTQGVLGGARAEFHFQFQIAVANVGSFLSLPTYCGETPHFSAISRLLASGASVSAAHTASRLADETGLKLVETVSFSVSRCFTVAKHLPGCSKASSFATARLNSDSAC